MPREQKELSFHRTEVTIQIQGNLFASSPTTTAGIEVMLEKNKPTETQLQAREALGVEHLKTQEELTADIVAATPVEEKGPSTVFRRDGERPYVHSNYLKGHLRECAEVLSRIAGIWALKDLVTRTVFVCPEKIFLEGEVKRLTTFVTFKVRLATGVTVDQATEKTAEYVENPELAWVLYIAGDPRWNELIFEQMLTFGAMRGLGPGRGVDTSKYQFTMSEWEALPYRDALARYTQEFAGPIPKR